MKAFTADLNNLWEDHEEKETWCIWGTEMDKSIMAELWANRRVEVDDIGQWTEAR